VTSTHHIAATLICFSRRDDGIMVSGAVIDQESAVRQA